MSLACPLIPLGGKGGGHLLLREKGDRLRWMSSIALNFDTIPHQSFNSLHFVFMTASPTGEAKFWRV